MANNVKKSDLLLDCIGAVREEKMVKKEVDLAKLSSYYDGVRDGISAVRSAIMDTVHEMDAEEEKRAETEKSSYENAFNCAVHEIFTQLGKEVGGLQMEIIDDPDVPMEDKYIAFAERLETIKKENQQKGFDEAAHKLFYWLGKEMDVSAKDIIADSRMSFDEKCAVFAERAKSPLKNEINLSHSYSQSTCVP